MKRISHPKLSVKDASFVPASGEGKTHNIMTTGRTGCSSVMDVISLTKNIGLKCGEIIIRGCYDR